ncbi:hypothetical protein DB347_04715 [Opitutaceae bacterium EW11]|nr:hypothetical protein DB347_04715 [Opitutaceae bacterium EW11]
MAFHIGTGSWADDEYAGLLYPPGTPSRERLSGYARYFNHAEVNSSYYATPRAQVVRQWLEHVPPGFTFSLKLHRAFAQNPAKAAEGPLVGQLLAGVEPLLSSGRLSAFLLVLPPDFRPDSRRLEELDTLASRLSPHPLAVELRHRDWVDRKRRDATLEHFRERRLVWVDVDTPQSADSATMPAVDEATHPSLAYLRLHGRNAAFSKAKSAAEGHHHAYTDAELEEVAKRARALARKAPEVVVVANNHAEDFAPKSALALKQRLTSGSSH